MKKNVSLNDHINVIKYRMNYININESPKYKEFIANMDEYDEIPKDLYEAGDEDLPPEDLGVPVKSEDPSVTPQPPVPDQQSAAPMDSGQPPVSPVPTDQPQPPVDGEMPQLQPETPSVDDIQNDIIKSNINAMKDINDNLANLSKIADELNGKLNVIAKDVDEVREPSNGEKLMSKSNVSYPYYFNLNNMWDGNWFNQKRGEMEEKGINKLDDGSYVADFDNLPKTVNIDDTFMNENFEPTGTSLIDGRGKQSAINLIYKKITPLTQGMFRDDNWSNIKRIFNAFGEMNLDFDILGNEYYGGFPPQGKKWQFEITFKDNGGKDRKIFGNITAAGAGTVEDPLERYDITVVLS